MAGGWHGVLGMMSITSVQVLLGWPRPRPPVGLSFWTFFNQPSLRSTWPCHLSRQIIKLHPLQEILRANLILGGDTSQIRLGPGFACMEHGTPDTWTLPLEVRTGRSSLNLPHATRHLVIAASPQPPPGARPTNDISIEFEIRPNFAVL